MVANRELLVREYEALRTKLGLMEDILSEIDEVKHFPSEGDEYYFYSPTGTILWNDVSNNSLIVNAYKTREEANKAYNKAVALEKVKRRLLELQGDWKPNFNDDCVKHLICYNYNLGCFEVETWSRVKYLILIPYIKTNIIANTIMREFHSELKIIFDIT